MINISELFIRPEGVDEKSFKMLLKSLIQNNQEGFDYLEFLASVKKLQELNMDVSTAMKSAYTTASTFGVTKQLLETSAKKYIHSIQEEYSNFRHALERQVQEKIIAPKDQLKNWEKELKDIDVQIEKLNKRKALIIASTGKSEMAIKDHQDALSAKEQIFRKSFEVLINKIEMDIQSIQQEL